jgi:hypothetical protein
MSDIEIELMAFLGTDFGQSLVAELGMEPVGLVFLAGARAQLSIEAADLRRIVGATDTKEAA